MYCKECGTKFEHDSATVCLNCGVKKCNGKKFCDYCGTEKKSENQDVCLSCGKEFKTVFGNIKSTTDSSEKTKLVALLLWLFLGGLGAHCFYSGNSSRGFVYLILFVATLFIGFTAIVTIILAIIDLVYILSNKFLDGNGKPITQWT